jgi:ABC-type multidrug transport system permease subunit
LAETDKEIFPIKVADNRITRSAGFISCCFRIRFGAIYKKAEGGNYIQFLAPGIIMMSVLFTAIFSGIELIWDKQFGFLKETMAAPVYRIQIMLGKNFGGCDCGDHPGSNCFAAYSSCRIQN